MTRTARDRVTTRIIDLQPSVHFGGPGSIRLFGEYRHDGAGGPLTTDRVTRDRNGVITNRATATGVSVPPAWRENWAGGISASQLVQGARLEGSLRLDALESHADSTDTIHESILDVTDRSWSADAGVARTIGTVEPYAHAGTGFRAPSLDERFFNGLIHGGLWVFGESGLVSEHSHSYEIGVRSSSQVPEWLRSARPVPLIMTDP